MNTVLWIVQGILAAAFLAAGGMKTTQAREQLVGRMAWMEDRKTLEVRLIGALEILGAVGLVLPGLLGWPAVWTQLAALGLALTMVGAIVVHLRRGEGKLLAGPLALFVLAVVVALGRK